MMSEEKIMDFPLVSIIVPIYNSQKYLSGCIESIRKQTYRNFELILVNDGSTDNSGSVCDDYAKLDARIIVRHLINGGVSYARNMGLEIIRGEWYCFVDADDIIAPNYLETLYQNAVKYDCAVSVCSHLKLRTREFKNVEKKNGQAIIIETPEKCTKNFIFSDKASMEGMVWNKLYKTCMFGELRFNVSTKVNEDCLYILEVMKRCQKACMTEDKLYYWYIHDDSACHKKPTQLDFSAADVNLALLQEVSEMHDEEINCKLKTNYVKSALRVLACVKFNRKDDQVRECIGNLKNWKKSVWTNLTMKEKCAYMMVIH